MLCSTVALAHADTGSGPDYSSNGNAILTVFATIIATPFLLAALWLILCGGIAAHIAHGKGRNGVGYFLLGLLFLGPFAILTAILVTPVHRTRPAWAGTADLLFGTTASKYLQRHEDDEK